MARIVVFSDAWVQCGALSDADDTIGDLRDRETAETVIATLSTIVNRCRDSEGRNLGGRLIQLEGDNR